MLAGAMLMDCHIVFLGRDPGSLRSPGWRPLAASTGLVGRGVPEGSSSVSRSISFVSVFLTKLCFTPTQRAVFLENRRRKHAQIITGKVVGWGEQRSSKQMRQALSAGC